MKKLMYVKNLTQKQYRAKERIIDLEHKMYHTKQLDDLKRQILECRKIWNYNFQTEELMNPDPNWEPSHEEIFRKRLRDLGKDLRVVDETPKAEKSVNVTAQSVAFTFRNCTFVWKEVK